MISIMALFVLSGCATFDRAGAAKAIAAAGDLQPLVVRGGPFALQAYARSGIDPTAPLTVYIEGDGLAYLRQGTRRSPDPTPSDPMGLRLAAAHPEDGDVLYLARPCQYRRDGPLTCSSDHWTLGRFGVPVIDSLERALRDPAVVGTPGRPLRLIGYSGGGVVAALLAARMAEARALITLASPLDHADWTRRKQLTPLSSSLNPRDFASALARVPQIHLAGAEDDRVPAEVVETYLDHLRAAAGDSVPAAALILAGQDHDCCWVDAWPDLYARALALLDRAGARVALLPEMAWSGRLR